MRHFVSAVIVLATVFSAGRSSAETLPLPQDLIRLDSIKGEELLIGAEARADYLPLSIYFTTQDNPAFCGPATIAMVLNALGVPRPASAMTLGLGLFDQENLFNARTETVKAKAEILRGGMTLDELGALLAAYGLDVKVVHASDSNLDEFRRAAAEDLADRKRLRTGELPAQGDRAGGGRAHFSIGCLRRRHRPIPDPRRISVQIPAGMGRGGKPICGDEHAGRRQRE